FFRLSDAVPLLLLIALLEFVGAQVSGNSSTIRLWARAIAALSFLLYAGFAIAAWRPATPTAFLVMTAQAVLAMGTAHGVALVTLPVVRFLYEHLWVKPLERQRKLQEAQARQAAAEKEAREKAEQEEAARAQMEA